MALTASDTVSLALSQLGEQESPPGSNRQKFGEWYGWNGVPWCAEYASWVLAHAGNGSGYRFASTASSVSWARRVGRLVPVADARLGDVLVRLYTSTTGHTGICTGVYRDETGLRSTTAEGNTSDENDRDGGHVMHRDRSLSWWHYCIRIDYPEAPARPPTTFPEDGMYRIDKTVTLDAAGNGWFGIDAPGRDVVSVAFNGADPATVGGYVPIPVWSAYQWSTGGRIVLKGGPPKGTVDLRVWVAGVP